MLALWPDLLFLSPLAALLVRMTLAIVFARVALRRFRSGSKTLRAFALVDVAIALALFLGAHTQLAALCASFCISAWLVRKDWRPLPQSTNALALIMTLTLILTGPGPFAYDLPL